MPLTVCVIGAGATGGAYGAMAARGGAAVTFVQRGAHGQKMAAEGLVVASGEGAWPEAVRPRVVADAAALVTAHERFDVVLVAVKSADLTAVLPAAAALAGTGPGAGIVVLAQNGVDAEGHARGIVPAEQLVGAVAIISAWVPTPGRVEYRGHVRLLVGAPAPAAQAAAERLAKALADVGVPASFSPDLASTRWTKLVWNNAWNVITTLTGLTVGHAARTPALRALAARAMAETAAVARASGVNLPAGIVELCLAQADAVGETSTSMLQDRLAGRPLEVEALCGTIVARGLALGIPTPVNDAFYPLLLGVHEAVAPGRKPG
jgi:2-dehydropantoate 2-reductase